MAKSLLFHLAILASSSLVSAIPSVPSSRKLAILQERRAREINHRQASEFCEAEAVPHAKATKENVWEQLSTDEVVGLIAWLHAPERGLNLTATVNATSWDNKVGITELLPPNKTDVLNYLDHNGPKPARMARVGIVYGATEKPYIQEYVVSPIPVSSSSTIMPLEYIYNRKSGGIIENPNADIELVEGFAISIAANISDITMDLLKGKVVNGSDSDDFALYGIDPLWVEDGRVISWLTFWGQANSYDSSTIQPQGLFMKLDITGRDWTKWKLLGWLYNNIMYNSTDEFRKAWQSPGFVKLPINKVGEWAATNRQGDELPLDANIPPAPVEVGGKRYSFDNEKKFIQWMDFSFYLSWNRDFGMGLHDIRYKGKRIIYELSLQEAIAHYAGDDPVQAGTSYLDSYYGFGSYAFELLPGYDCPSYATFMNTTTHNNEVTTTHKNSICMFEFDKGFPIRRHASFNYITASKNVVFILRSITTIGNYDYDFDYVFSLDGSIEVKVRASGYIQGAYWTGNSSSEHGYRINEALSGSMHDHVLTFKADLDVLGVKNSMQVTKLVPKEKEYVWSNGKKRNTFQLESEFIKNEDQGKLDWPVNAAGMFTVVNKDTPNEFGELPGYRIMPGAGTPIRLTVQNSDNLKNTARFAEHNIFVTKQKDSELRCSHANNGLNTSSPLIDFAKFSDGENLEQEDLVVWFNLGMHHVPHTGDLPLTVASLAQSSMIIAPHNYLPGDPSSASKQQVELRYSSLGGVESVNLYNKPKSECGAVRVTDILPSMDRFEEYEGSSQVRKFPFDPNKPIFELQAP